MFRFIRTIEFRTGEHEGNVENTSRRRVFSTFLECSQMSGVFYQCNTRLTLLHLLYDIEVMWRKKIKHAFSMFYTLIKHGFLTNLSARTILSIL